MPQEGFDLLLPGMVPTAHLGRNHSAMLYHPLQIAQKQIKCHTQMETAFGQYHIFCETPWKAQNIYSSYLGLQFSPDHGFVD